MTKLKLSEVIRVWEHLHHKDTGDVGFADLERAIRHSGIEVENDISPCQPEVAVREVAEPEPATGDDVNLLETTDATVWAAEFERLKKKNRWTLEQIDPDLMVGWFANAMCAQMDKDRVEIDVAQRGDPSDLRFMGWTVAVHSDYRLDDQGFTFWLLTKGDLAVKGEGRNDAEALDIVRARVEELERVCNPGELRLTRPYKLSDIVRGIAAMNR